MTAGLQALTDTGIFQIDGESSNFQLVASLAQATALATLPTVYNNVGNQFSATYQYVIFSFSASNPLFAFTADGNVMVAPWRFTRSGNSYTASFITSAPTIVRLYIFDNVLPANSNFGLQVFSSAAALIADAASPFCKVIDVKSGQYLGGVGWDASGTGMPGPQTASQTYPVNVAIAGCWPAHYMYDIGSGSSGETTMLGVAVSGGTVTWEFHTFSGTRQPHFIGFRECTAYRFMVLDMTGII